MTMCDILVHSLTCFTEGKNWTTKLLMITIFLSPGLFWVLSTCVNHANLSSQYSKYIYLRINK